VYGATVHAGEGKIAIWDLGNNKMTGTIKTDGPGLFIRSSDKSPYVWADALFGNPANKIYVFDKNPPFKLVKVIEEGTQTLHPEFTALLIPLRSDMNSAERDGVVLGGHAG
jgi:hypothetical protein